MAPPPPPLPSSSSTPSHTNLLHPSSAASPPSQPHPAPAPTLRRQQQAPLSPTRVLADAEAQWLFSLAELDNTPSIQDGMTPAEERETRAKGVGFIVQVGILLKLPQLTVSTAATFLQRFLMRASLKRERDGIPKLHHYQAAATALFLATKVEESGRRMKELILAFCRVAQKNPNLVIDEQSKDWWRWRDCILHNEDVLLEALCFDLTIDSPHGRLSEMLKWYRIGHHKRLRNAAWGFVTDGNNTPLCLLCDSRTIAVAGLYAACRYCDVSLPDDAQGRPWWVVQRVRLSDVRRAIDYMCDNYDPASGTIHGISVGGHGVDLGGNGSGNGGNGGNGDNGGGGGESSIYANLSTPGDVDRDRDGDGDGTRLRDSRSPASSIGVKRGRDHDGADAPSERSNGFRAEKDGDGHEEKKNKRMRVDGDAEPRAEEEEDSAGPDVKLREEALRVADGNRQEEHSIVAGAGDAGTMTMTTSLAAAQHGQDADANGEREKLQEDEGSEEGEVEE